MFDDNSDLQILEENIFLINNFVCYAIDRFVENIIGKILSPSKYPLYVIFEKDSIVSCFFYEEMKKNVEENDENKLYHSLLNYKREYNGDANDNILYFNALLKLYRYLEEQHGKLAIDIGRLETIIESNKGFYGRYLLAQLYKGRDIEKADEIYNDLWINSTSDEMELYPEEFMEILKNKNHLVFVDKEDVKFDYTEYDFGTIAPFEEVDCRFYFTNKSDKKFVIHNVVTTCGCTVPSWNQEPIKSNVRDSISVRFKTKDVGISKKNDYYRREFRAKD